MIASKLFWLALNLLFLQFAKASDDLFDDSTSQCNKVVINGHNVYMGYMGDPNKKYSYFWNLFISEKKGLDVPVLIYFRGELGLSTIAKVYNGIGPVSINPKTKVFEDNQFSLTKEYHLLAIDFPCGIGFLNTSTPECPDNSNYSFQELAQELVEPLKQFLKIKEEQCYIHNMLQLPFYIWSEGLNANLATTLFEALSKDAEGSSNDNDNPLKDLKLKGVILGDPLIDIVHQSHNYASMSLGRSVGSLSTYSKFLELETLIQVIKMDNTNFCLKYRYIFDQFDLQKQCPWDLSRGCPKRVSETTTRTNTAGGSPCHSLFIYDDIETDLESPLLKILKDKAGILSYDPDISRHLQTVKLYDSSYIKALVSVVNKTPLLIYQSQHNFLINSISTMMFIDPLRWENKNKFITSKTYFKKIESSGPFGSISNHNGGKYSVRVYGNLRRAQIFGSGGLYTYSTNSIALRDNIFKEFCENRLP